MKPEELLEILKSNSSRKVAATMQAVFDTCKEQVERGASDFSYSTISKFGLSKGVPKVQSIRNKSGEKYRSIIKAFENQYGRKVTKGAEVSSWIDDIDDARLQLLARVQEAELVECKRKLKEIIPPNMEIVVREKNDLDTPQLTPIERRALEYIKSSKFLELWGFKLGSRGEVLDKGDNKVFPVGTVDAIDKVLRYL